MIQVPSARMCQSLMESGAGSWVSYSCPDLTVLLPSPETLGAPRRFPLPSDTPKPIGFIFILSSCYPISPGLRVCCVQPLPALARARGGLRGKGPGIYLPYTSLIPRPSAGRGSEQVYIPAWQTEGKVTQEEPVKTGGLGFGVQKGRILFHLCVL